MVCNVQNHTQQAGIHCFLKPALSSTNQQKKKKNKTKKKLALKYTSTANIASR
jgi:hypothetical protein